MESDYGKTGTGADDPISIISNQPMGFKQTNHSKLDVLVNLGVMKIDQEVDYLEAFTGCQKQKMFRILDNQGQLIFMANEESECCSRNCWKAGRPFEMPIVDGVGEMALKVKRPLKCTCGCCPQYCRQILEVLDENE